MEIWGCLKDKFKSKENCVVPNCETKRNKNNSQVTLFSFPKNEALKKIWSDNLGITDCMFLKYQKLRVCSLHFSSDAIIWAGNRFILTSKNVVPNKIAKQVIPEPLAEVVPQPSTSYDVCARNGYNNNPTCRQFIAGYKQLLVHSQVKSFSGNVGETDGTELLATLSRIQLSTSDESCGYSLQCTDNANCTTIVATASCAPDGFCQCPAGYVFTTDFTQCIAEVLYGVRCTDGVQCSHMLTGGYCDATNVCSCKSEYTFIRGRCRKLVGLDERCNEDIDCQFNFDRESVTCRNNVCSCADGFYLRTENVCRRISMNDGEPCIVQTDCQGVNLSCNETSNVCILNTVGIQTELYSLPQTRSVSTQAGEIPPSITAEKKSDEEDEIDEEIENANFGDTCTNEGGECNGLAHSVCRNNLCHCKPGYYLKSKLCKAEVGEPAVSSAYCDGEPLSNDYRDGKCLCGINRFSNPDLKICVKASIGYNKSCSQFSQCTPYGLAYCTSAPPKVCRCYPYATYNETTQLCTRKVGFEEFCTESSSCTLKNTVCSNENTCVCASNYIAIDSDCRPGEGAKCSTTDECGFENSECVDNVEGTTSEKYCKCKSGFIYHASECIPEVPYDEECAVDEQCKPLLGELSECRENQCNCEEDAHFKDDKCHKKKKLDDRCTKSSECYLEENQDRVVCRNEVCKCKFDYTADVEKQQCIIIKNKNSSGRPSPLKVITIILMTSAALITSAAIREAYFVR